MKKIIMALLVLGFTCFACSNKVDELSERLVGVIIDLREMQDCDSMKSATIELQEIGKSCLEEYRRYKKEAECISLFGLTSPVCDPNPDKPLRCAEMAIEHIEKITESSIKHRCCWTLPLIEAMQEKLSKEAGDAVEKMKGKHQIEKLMISNEVIAKTGTVVDLSAIAIELINKCFPKENEPDEIKTEEKTEIAKARTTKIVDLPLKERWNYCRPFCNEDGFMLDASDCKGTPFETRGPACTGAKGISGRCLGTDCFPICSSVFVRACLDPTTDRFIAPAFNDVPYKTYKK